MIRRVAIQRRVVRGAPPRDAHPVAGRVLAARGLEALPDYSLSRMLPPTLGGLEAAAELLAEAVTAGQRILIVGDFDADGATGTALAVRALKAMGAGDVHWRVPDRFRHGYGLSAAMVEDCLPLKPAVLVTVDQGISSHEGIMKARQAGMKVVVTDHHLPGPTLPDAHAIVNPALPDDPFPSRCLAGVGVIFYTMAATRSRLRAAGWFSDRPEPRMDQWLDLVALGTVADLVPLDDNNRLLVWQGLKRIAAGKCAPGIQVLLEVAGRNPRLVSASDLGFSVAPRLNAAGRLEDMGEGIQCLLAPDLDTARPLAARLDELNRSRQDIQAGMQAEAEQQVDSMLASLGGPVGGLCVFDPGWHSGVVGLVAGRLKDRLQRPVIALAPAGNGSTEVKGSARSPGGVHMRDLLVGIDTQHPGLIQRFGGHARAAGLSLERDQVQAFTRAFDRLVGEMEFEPERVLTDGEIAPNEFGLDAAQAIFDAGPWGQGWPEPLFDGRFRVLERRTVGHHHLKLRVQPVTGGPELEAIAFRAGTLVSGELPDPLHITYRLELNRWMGRVTLQLNVQHLVEKLAPPSSAAVRNG